MGYLSATFGVESVDEQGNYIDKFLQPEMKEALALYNKIMRYGYAQPEQLLYENNKIKKMLKEEPILCFIGNFANTSVIAPVWQSSGVILSDSGNVPVYMQNLRRSIGWINTFISKDCEWFYDAVAYTYYESMMIGKGDTDRLFEKLSSSSR